MTEEIDKTEKGVFRLKKYSFLLRDVDFSTTKNYKIDKQNNKLYINLASPAECTMFFEDLADKNLRASSLVYYYFVYGKSPTGEELNFNDLVKYIKELCAKNDDTKNLVNCFKVIIEGMNYKIIVTSYFLVKYLNADKLFRIYENHNNYYNFNWFNNGVDPSSMYGKGMYGKGMYGKGMYGKGMYGKGMYGKGMYGNGNAHNYAKSESKGKGQRKGENNKNFFIGKGMYY